MAVYAICIECSTRRDKCLNLSAHKRHIKWRADVHLSNGERLRRMFLNKELADIQERQWLTDYERGLLLPKNTLITKSFEEVSQEWWNVVAVGQNRIKNSNASEKYRVQMFNNLFGRRLLVSLKPEDGEKWLTQRLEEGKAVNTINRDMKPLKWIMDFAVQRGYLKENPFKNLKQLKGANIRIRWMSEAELDALTEAARKLGDFDLVDIIAVGVNTGFRKGNLERLSSRDVGEIRITASQTKSGKPYDVPISPALLPVITKLVKNHPTGPLLNTTKLDRRFRVAAKQAKLYLEKGNPDNVTIHTLRHTFAALYLKNGGDLYKLSKLMGHSSIAITESVYAHICPKELDAQAALLGTKVKMPMFKLA